MMTNGTPRIGPVMLAFLFLMSFPQIGAERDICYVATSGSDCAEGNLFFHDPSEVDFHPRESSRATDSGSPIDAPGEDFDQNVRPRDAGYDIGAFGFMGTYDEPPNCESFIFDLSGNYPNQEEESQPAPMTSP